MQKFIPRITFYGNPESNAFALTFDDGPLPPFTDQVLDILDQYNAKATFFLIGSRIEQYPNYVDIMRARGHQVANHSFYDQRTVFMKTESLMRSIRQTETLIQQTQWPKLLRPGSGWIRPDQLDAIEAEGYHIVLGSAYVSDPLHPPRWYMQQALTSMLRPGAIVVLHDGIKDPTKTVAVLPALLEEARYRGLKAVTLNQLFNQTEARRMSDNPG
ncbi:MAG: polysaccharide deacetylase family protein [Anaerolineae bacterium]|nr:polysaccharide deacetylase family protein [Anaerolineae bacterium]